MSVSYTHLTTRDGVRVEIGLNLGSVSTQALEASHATDFVGLLRTEFLYLEASHMPTEEEQYTAYKKVLLEYAPRPVTVRTLDIGGEMCIRDRMRILSMIKFKTPMVTSFFLLHRTSYHTGYGGNVRTPRQLVTSSRLPPARAAAFRGSPAGLQGCSGKSYWGTA